MANTKSLKGTQTEKNLAASYVAESCAYTRYTFFAQQAQKEKYFQYANIFNETAANELRHAKIYLQYLAEEGCTTPPMGVDAGILAPTAANLKVAAAEEEKEGVEMYTNAAKVAKEEGFDEIADRFLAIATIENHHKERFEKMSGTHRERHCMEERQTRQMAMPRMRLYLRRHGTAGKMSRMSSSLSALRARRRQYLNIVSEFIDPRHKCRGFFC